MKRLSIAVVILLAVACTSAPTIPQDSALKGKSAGSSTDPGSSAGSTAVDADSSQTAPEAMGKGMGSGT
jgi:hypothetical protein